MNLFIVLLLAVIILKNMMKLMIIDSINIMKLSALLGQQLVLLCHQSTANTWRTKLVVVLKLSLQV